MVYDYSEIVEHTQGWAAQACAEGWISTATAEALAVLDTKTPDSLFSQQDARPLIVAFMGGSGVGKSTLLNRLAGKPIARVGVERPTSREVTLFHHHSVAIQQLPEHLPITHIKIAQHEDETKKQIIWIDMPDFDSTEQANKQLVLQWLPHIDVLIYVVSPERYRDEKAWQILLTEGAKHAWLFVLNQWDRGQPEQYDDFKQQLHKAGFFEPVIFKTICADEWQEDEFSQLEATLMTLAQGHTVQQLQQRSQVQRKKALQQQLQTLRTGLAAQTSLADLPTLWNNQWQQTCDVLQQGLSWPIKNAANYYAEHAPDLLGNGQANRIELWDHWAQTRFDDALDTFILDLAQQALPVTPLKTALAELRNKPGKILQSQNELAVRQALAKPGHALHRGFLKTMRFVEITFPLAAMSWVGYQVFMGFYYSNLTSTHYLGVDFAIHSALLIAITWLVPFFILKKAQPSLQKSALKGLQKGVSQAFDVVGEEVLQTLISFIEAHTGQLQQLDDLIRQCDCPKVEARLAVESDSVLNRMLVE
jgi:GTPase Era involved in 16S rRNA processing